MVETNKLSVKIAGPAGEGILSAGRVLAKSCSRGGLHVVTENERPSLIRGGHNQFMIRIEEEFIHSHIELGDVLLALDKSSVEMHAHELTHEGAIIYDAESFSTNHDEIGRHDLHLIGLPMHSIIKDIGAGKIVENAIALGACFGLVDYDLKMLNTILKEEYKKHPEALEADIKAAKAGYDFVKKQNITFKNNLRTVKAPKRMLINGITAFNLGAVKAGVSFLSQYPMTPSTGVIQGLTPIAEDKRIVIVQTEDEISSINMALGASYAGARAMTASSGGGYALMNEGISLAGVTEASVVICEVQRGGPGTGLPTRTEQSDLLFVLHSGHGEFPHMVVAPSIPESCYVEAQRAFNIAEKFQTPVTVLLDRHNAETFHTVEKLPQDLPIERSIRYTEEENPDRYEITDSGVSRRFDPGYKDGRVVVSGNEHDASGLINDERHTRTEMVLKRQRKLDSILKELPKPKLDGDADADYTFVSWGSTLPIISEARTFLKNEGKTTAHLHLTYMNPFHSEEVKEILGKVKNPVIIENNTTSQLGQLIQMRTGILIEKKILQFDGWPFSPERIMNRVLKEDWNGF